MPIHAHFFRQAIMTGKVGQSDLVFGVGWGSVLARLQVSAFSSYDFCHRV